MRKNETVRLQVVIPFHQPLSATHAQLAEACERCYIPLIAALEKHESVRVALHFGGHILDYLARSQEGFLLRVKNLCKRGQVEILGGLFYGGIPALLPEFDVRSQIEMSAEFWESFVGVTPKGFWLTELAWAPELPRLLDETALAYGFVASSQVQLPSGPAPSLGSLQRGGHKIAAFLLDSALSQALPARPAVEWMQAVRDVGAKGNEQVLSVWVRAESLGLEPGTYAWCHEQHWLSQWFTALTEGLQATLVLPQETFPSVHPAQPLSLRHVCAPELQAFGADAPASDWADFAYQFAEVDTLYRRMLRASAKLREAIGVMEDEELEDRWSDHLATAQRLVFSSQAPDVYYRGQTPGFNDPNLRDATMARLLRAENIMDNLVQGDEDWLSFEEVDLDDDGVDEEFIATRRLSVWLDAKRGNIRTLENRVTECNVLDVGGRRRDVRLSEEGNKGTSGNKRHEARPPTDQSEGIDSAPRRGMREWLVEPETTAEALFGGQAVSFIQPNHTWEVMEHGVDEDGDCSYQLQLRSTIPLPGMPGGVENVGRRLICHKAIRVPIDAARISLEYTWELQGGSPVLWALELPVRLGAQDSRLFVEGKQVLPPQAASQGRAAYVEGADGSVMLLEFSRPTPLWWHPVRTMAKDLQGWTGTYQGLLLAPVVRIDGHAGLKINIDLQRRADKV